MKYLIGTFLIFGLVAYGETASFTVTIPDEDVAALDTYVKAGGAADIQSWIQELVDNAVPAGVSAGEKMSIKAACDRLNASEKAAVKAALGADPCQ